jgi:hypothetical protein
MIVFLLIELAANQDGGKCYTLCGKNISPVGAENDVRHGHGGLTATTRSYVGGRRPSWSYRWQPMGEDALLCCFDWRTWL